MEYLIGVALALALTGVFAAMGFDRDRSFYPVVLIVVATYYVLFAVMDVSGRAVTAEIVVAMGFTLLALVGSKGSVMVVAIAIAGHGLFDVVHHLLIDNPGMPRWWPGFCMSFDVVFGAAAVGRLWWRRAKA